MDFLTGTEFELTETGEIFQVHSVFAGWAYFSRTGYGTRCHPNQASLGDKRAWYFVQQSGNSHGSCQAAPFS